MSNIVFLPEGWEDYLYWQGQDKKTLRKINHLLQIYRVTLLKAWENRNLCAVIWVDGGADALMKQTA